jgi:hypothetical protein
MSYSLPPVALRCLVVFVCPQLIVQRAQAQSQHLGRAALIVVGVFQGKTQISLFHFVHGTAHGNLQNVVGYCAVESGGWALGGANYREGD